MLRSLAHGLLPVWRLSERRLLRVALVLLLGLTAAALEGFGIGLIIPLLAVVTGSPEVGGSGLVAWLRDFGAGFSPAVRVVVISAAMFGLVALRNLVVFANSALSARIASEAGHRIRSELARRLLWSDYAFVREQEPGRLLNIVSNESWRTVDCVNWTLAFIVNASAALILYVFLLALSWPLTAMVSVVLLILLLVHGRLARRLQAPSRALSAANGRLSARALDVIHAAQLVRLFNQQRREQARFEAASDDVRAGVLQLRLRSSLLLPLSEILFAGFFLLLIVAAWRWGFGFPLVATFMVLLYRLQPYVRNLQWFWGQVVGWTGALESVGWLLGAGDRVPAPTGSIGVAPLADSIRFEGVSFAYGREQPATQVLRRASFVIPARKATGIVGRSGAGKSTVVQLLTRLVEPGEGCILIDGIPLRDIDPASWRSRVAVASQELELVNASVLDNIAYGMPDASRSDVERAARLAEAHEFIERLPEGYLTAVGPRGFRLSAGQRQRIALARAILAEPEVLILDEATSAVDGISEVAILETIRRRSGRGTTLLISHHHRTLSVCDHVVILNGGRVAAQAEWMAVRHLGMEELYEVGASGLGAPTAQGGP